MLNIAKLLFLVNIIIKDKPFYIFLFIDTCYNKSMISKINNKGFVFIETIITVVILTTTLVFLYSTYSKVINTEKKRLYYDDIAYIYKTAVIGDILTSTIDTQKFNTAFSNATTCTSTNDTNCRYLYIFNIGSDIYKHSSLITSAYNLLNFNRLVYLKIADIPTIKSCLKGNDNSKKCANTKSFIEAYAYSYLSDYLLTIDVPHDSNNKYNNRKGILISLIYENKNGGLKIDEGKYEECLQEKIYSHYNIAANASDSVKKNAINKYYNDDTFYFNMQCENAYYISWVYL